ncbi:MAG: hypothetical protein EB127_01915 [Alphaproteobacteria bacterium]|jgi:hypothetical protein|nr:hypothetical protein [Alphaproteobacteria bacterium]
MDKYFIDPESVQSHYNMTSSNHLFAAPAHNGAVSNIKDEKTNAYAARAYKMTPEDGNIFDISMRQDMVGHLHQETPLNQVFFSDTNLDKLQNDIQDQVLLMSNGKYRIGRQSDINLKIIMRSYYLMYGKNGPDVAADLADLNARVVGYAAAKVYSEVDFHEFYINDIQDFAPPIANPMNVAMYGTRTGELKSFF